ncbi:MAG: hypothetical protein RIS73_1, partial [Bacteroidota bacterium]
MLIITLSNNLDSYLALKWIQFMGFSQFIVLILICYGIYYSIVLGIDFFSNKGKATTAVPGHSAHGVSFELR